MRGSNTEQGARVMAKLISQPNKSTNVRSLISRQLGPSLAWLGRQSPTLGALAAESLFLSPRRHERPDWEAALLAKARRFHVAYAGKQLPAWEWGEGPTVLLIHGWEGRGSQLGKFVAPLVRSGHRVVTLDLPGHGDAPSARVSVVDFARVIAQVHKQLGEIEGVIAHSVGAAASTFAYALSPFAERMVLIAPPRGPRRFFEGFVNHLSLDGATIRAVEERLLQRYGLALDDIDAGTFGPFVRANVLVIHDRDDREVPFEHGQVLAENLPFGRLFETRGLGHRRILRDRAVIREATRFVASPEARPFAEQLDDELFDRSQRVA
jgi:pimeloyl-ACP methyl ester carboxylesterase